MRSAIAMLTGSLLFGVPSFAQTSDDHKEHHGEGDKARATDKDKGQEALKKKFAAVDTNHDETISQDEYFAAAKTRHSRIFSGYDANQDQSLSLEEFLGNEASGKHFGVIDENSDGSLSREELFEDWLWHREDRKEHKEHREDDECQHGADADDHAHTPSNNKADGKDRSNPAKSKPDKQARDKPGKPDANDKDQSPKKPGDGFEKHFTAIDTDGNGQVSREEFTAWRRGIVTKQFENLDGDKNGSVALAEFLDSGSKQREQHFKAADCDNSGGIDFKEFTEEARFHAKDHREHQHHRDEHGEGDEHKAGEGKRHDKHDDKENNANK